MHEVIEESSMLAIVQYKFLSDYYFYFSKYFNLT